MILGAGFNYSALFLFSPVCATLLKMATYFQAAKAAKVFTEYKRLTQAYWQAQPEDGRGWMARGLPALESDATFPSSYSLTIESSAKIAGLCTA